MVHDTDFRWTTFDVRSLLPADWVAQILNVARRFAQRKVLITRHSTSREERPDFELPTQTVGGDRLHAELPWLRVLYESTFLRLAQLTTTEQVSVMNDDRFALALNIQTG